MPPGMPLVTQARPMRRSEGSWLGGFENGFGGSWAEVGMVSFVVAPMQEEREMEREEMERRKWSRKTRKVNFRPAFGAAEWGSS
jgi:hypothetical protein